MSFSAETEKLVNELIQAEYKNACEKFGEKYNSLHEGYAVLKEEVEEVKEQIRKLRLIKPVWNEIKKDNKTVLYKLLELMEIGVICAIKELAQVGAVLMKIKNTLQSKEETTEKRKVCSKDCEYIIRAYGSYFCNGQKNAPCVNLGNDCYYNDRTEEYPF